MTYVDDDDPDPDEYDGSVEPDDDVLPDGVYYDQDLPTVVCKQCRQDYLEDSPQCPHCGYAINQEQDFATPRSGFFWVMMALAMGIVLLAMVF